jgi:AcrR family transcriptional regulator
MPRSEEHNRRIREAQRARILDAAKEVFVRKGWTATMAEIAAAARISQGLAYRYFPSKDSIFMELMKQLAGNNLQEISRIRNLGGPPTERLELILTEVLKRIENFEITIQATLGGGPQAHFSFFRMHLQQMRNGSPEEKESMQMMQRQYLALRDGILEILAEGQESGEFIREDPQKQAVMILSCVKGLASLAIHRPDQFKAHYPYTGPILRMVKADKTPGG